MRDYPPQSELKAVLKAVCSKNSFSLEELLSSSSALASPAQKADCLRVTQVPVRPVGGINRARWWFGIDSDGYIMVVARTPAAKRVWPQTKAGAALPVRLHRWMANVRPGGQTLHSCDDPTCICRAHMSPGTRSTNAADCWRRLRREPRPPSSPIQTPRAQPPPPLPRHDERTATREAIFVVAGFGSPSKLARKLVRRREGESRPPSRMGVLCCLLPLQRSARLGGT